MTGLRTRLAGAGRFASGWVRRHPYYTAAILAELAYLFLPFYDPNNIPLALDATTTFTSSSPVFSHENWVAGPFVNAAYIPMSLAYAASGYQLYWAYTTYKLILFGLTATMAYATYRVFLGRGERIALAVAMFTILNPVWIVVNGLWVQYDLVSVAFFALGYILLRWGHDVLTDGWRVAAACVLITISVFFYWFALAVLPLLLLYTPGLRAKAMLALGLVASLGAMWLASAFLLGNDLLNYSGALFGGNAALNRTALFGLQHYFPLTTPEYAAVLFLLGIVVPIAGYLARLAEAAVGLAVLSVFLLTSIVPTPDNYVFIWPFAVLAFASVPVTRFRMAYLWAAIAYPLAGLGLVTPLLNNAQPDGVGVFLWTYSLSHQNVTFLPWPREYILIFNAATVAGVALSVGVVAWVTYPRREAVPEVPRPTTGTGAPRGWRPTRRATVGLTTTAVVLGVAALAFNAGFPSLTDYSGQGRPPVEWVHPQFYPDNLNVVESIPGQTWTVSGNTLRIYAASPPMVFGRLLIDQAIDWSANVTLQGPLARSTLLVQTGTIFASIENDSGPNASAVGPLTPTYSSGGVPSEADRPLLGHGPASTYLDGNATREYNVTGAGFLGHSFALAFNASTAGRVQSTIVFLNGTRGIAAVVLRGGSAFLVYGQDNATKYTMLRFPFAPEEGTWGYVAWTATATGVWFDLDGWSVSVAGHAFAKGTTSIVLGRPDYPAGPRDAFAGNDSPLYASPTAFPNSSSYRFVAAGAGSPDYLDLPTPSVSLRYLANLTEATLVANGTSFRAGAIREEGFGFGKYGNAPYGVTATLLEFRVTQAAPDRYYLVPVFVTFVLPYLMVAATWPAFRRLSGPPPPPDGPGRTGPTDLPEVG